MIDIKLVPAAATLALCTALTATPSFALDFYAGGSVGQATVDNVRQDDINDGSLSGINIDDSDTGWKLFGGAQMGKYVALEASWVDLGEASIAATADEDSDNYAEGAVNLTTEASGLAMEILGMYPVTDSINVFGRFGLFVSEVDQKLADSSSSLSYSEENRDMTFGLGAKYKFAERYSIRAEWQRFKGVGGNDVGSSDIDLMTVGADVSF